MAMGLAVSLLIVGWAVFLVCFGMSLGNAGNNDYPRAQTFALLAIAGAILMGTMLGILAK